MRKQTGYSLLELLIAMSLLSVLFGMTFTIFRMGAGAWLTNDTKAELLGRIQALSARIGRLAENSSWTSLSITDSDLAHGCAFLVAADDDGRFQYDPYYGQPDWTRAQVFYFVSGTETVHSISYPLVGTSRRERFLDYSARFMTPAVDPTFNPSPENALKDKFTGGQPIAQQIKDLRFEKVERDITLSSGDTVSRNYQQLAIEITVEKDSFGANKPIELKSRAVYLMRN